MKDCYYMMWLTRSLNLNYRKASAILEFVNNPKDLWNLKKNELEKIPIINNSVISALNLGKNKINDWIREVDNAKVEFISINHPDYPILLKNIYQPPLGIYFKGVLPTKEDTLVSLIGARRCSDYGRQVGYKLGKDLANFGVIVVSGMARGIDSMGHRGALDAKGKTIAILGFGHNTCYPAENKDLMEQISNNGCLISEYPPDYAVNSYYFPQRNRIIAGISKGLIVLEAEKVSGTMITVDFALETGRTVMTVPGNITSKLSEGTNNLIKDGCPIVTSAKDVLFELGIEKTAPQPQWVEVKIPISEEEQKVYALIGSEAVTMEYIMKVLKMPVQDIQYILTMLELGGHIQKLPGERYIKAL